MNIKIFDKNMKSVDTKDFNYSFNKKYTTNNLDNIKTGTKGFYYYDSTDSIFGIYDTIDFFGNRHIICEVDPSGKIVDIGSRKCCSQITVLKELTYEDLLELDNTGMYTYYYILYHIKFIDKERLSVLEDMLIEKDKTGRWCGLLIMHTEDVDMNKLQKAISKKNRRNYK
jgi:hypothetical protein